MLRTLRLWVVTFFATLRARLAAGPLVPSWSFGFEWIVRYLRRDWDETSRWELPRVRGELHARFYPTPSLRRVRTHDVRLGGVVARSFEPPGAAADRVVLFFHGGSFIYGSPHGTHAELIARVALESGVRVVAPEYRLAPEHPFPAQLEDACAVYEALLAQGLTSRQMVLAGDSAGGNLALELALRLRDLGQPQPAGIVGFSPWSDLRMTAPSFTENDPYDYGTRSELERHARAYAPAVAPDDPRLSPACARLDGLAPTLIVVGEREIPRDDILTLARRLSESGVETTLHVARDMPHNAAVFAAYHPSGKLALATAAAFLRQVLAQRPL